MNQGILVLFGLLVTFILILRRKQLAESQVGASGSKFKKIAIGVMLVSILLGVRSFLAPEDLWSKLAFWIVFFAACPFLLKRIKGPLEVMQLLLLVVSICCTLLFNQIALVTVLCSMLLGLIIYKLVENCLFASENSFEDILPSVVWFSGLAWANLLGKDVPTVGNTLLLCLSLSLIFKTISTSFLSKDKFFGKRILLSIFAGLALLISFKVALLQSNMMILAALFAVGTLFGYFFENTSSKEEIHNLLLSMSFLVGVGILTLVSTRLVGDIGVVVLAAACCTTAGKGLFAALFWTSRLLIQGFVLNNVANVTGINLMHPYCSAALFFGFLAILFLSLILHINTKSWLSLTTFLSMGLLLPPAVIYLIHEESAASFLIAANVVALSLVSFTGLIYKEAGTSRQNNLMLMPLFLSTSSLLFAPLIAIGNQATIASRLQIVSYAIAALVVIYFILSNIIRMARNPV